MVMNSVELTHTVNVSASGACLVTRRDLASFGGSFRIHPSSHKFAVTAGSGFPISRQSHSIGERFLRIQIGGSRFASRSVYDETLDLSNSQISIPPPR